jgi:hypothetical protein
MPELGEILETLWLLLTLVLCMAVFADSWKAIGLLWASVFTILVAIIMIAIAWVFKKWVEQQ